MKRGKNSCFDMVKFSLVLMKGVSGTVRAVNFNLRFLRSSTSRLLFIICSEMRKT